MKRPPIVGIAGPARSGKDTMANFVIALTSGYRYGFADPLKAMLLPLGIDMREPYWIENKEKVIHMIGKSPRELIQTLGTEWGRELVHPNLWVLLAHRRFILGQPQTMVLPDVRFTNEQAWIIERGGVIIHLRRNDAEKVREHVSENPLPVLDRDFVVENNGTLQDLHIKCSAIFGNLEVGDGRD